MTDEDRYKRVAFGGPWVETEHERIAIDRWLATLETAAAQCRDQPLSDAAKKVLLEVAQTGEDMARRCRRLEAAFDVQWPDQRDVAVSDALKALKRWLGR